MDLKATRKIADDLADIAGAIEKYYIMDGSTSRVKEPIQKIETLIKYLKEARPSGAYETDTANETRAAKIAEISRLQEEYANKSRKIKAVQENLIAIQQKTSMLNKI